MKYGKLTELQFPRVFAAISLVTLSLCGVTVFVYHTNTQAAEQLYNTATKAAPGDSQTRFTLATQQLEDYQAKRMVEQGLEQQLGVNIQCKSK